MNSFLKNKASVLPYGFVFAVFLFFNTIFNGSTRTNNLLHLAILFIIFRLFADKALVQRIITDKTLVRGLLCAGAFMLYFTATNLWPNDNGHLASTFNHSLYLLFYITMTALVLSSGARQQVMALIVAGFTLVVSYLLISNFHVILNRGPVTVANPTAQNVIDLAGLASIGLILAITLFLETRNKLILPCMAILAFFILLTQSRGPVLALAISWLLCKGFPRLTRKNISIALIIVIISAVFIETTELGALLRLRVEDAYTQSFLRFSIWRHTAELISQHWLLGNGFDYELAFINYSGEHISTTHSLYFGTLLKGGVIGGILLLILLGYILRTAFKYHNQRVDCGAVLVVFSIVFYLTEGMFVIGNPAPEWYLFWFPIGYALSRSPATLKGGAKITGD